jgi:hypothetical protein
VAQNTKKCTHQVPDSAPSIDTQHKRMPAVSHVHQPDGGNPVCALYRHSSSGTQATVLQNNANTVEKNGRVHLHAATQCWLHCVACAAPTCNSLTTEHLQTRQRRSRTQRDHMAVVLTFICNIAMLCHSHPAPSNAHCNTLLDAFQLAFCPQSACTVDCTHHILATRASLHAVLTCPCRRRTDG